MKKLRLSILSIIIFCLVIMLSGCGGGSDGGENVIADDGAQPPAYTETRGDLETLSREANSFSQPHYQEHKILSSSYIQSINFDSQHSLIGSIKSIFSLYSGDTPPEYSSYEIYKYTMAFNVTDKVNNNKINISVCELVTELNGGEYCLGGTDLENPENIIWEDEPVLFDFDLYETGTSFDFNSLSLGSGSMVILDKEFVIVDSIRYATWKTFLIQQINSIYTETYSWIHPDYGIIKMQMHQTDTEENSTMYLDVVLKESY